MFLPIYVYGQPVLRKKAQDITPDYPELATLIENMKDTMSRSNGVGLAAPQIGLDIRLVVIDLDVLKEEFPEYEGYRHTFINARVLETNEEEETDVIEEGCLSLPGIQEPVHRATRIRVSYMDENFEEHDEWVEGYLARVMQHEFDHLEGVLFIDHLSGLRKQMIRSKLNNMIKGKVRCSYKVKTLKKGR